MRPTGPRSRRGQGYGRAHPSRTANFSSSRSTVHPPCLLDQRLEHLPIDHVGLLGRGPIAPASSQICTRSDAGTPVSTNGPAENDSPLPNSDVDIRRGPGSSGKDRVVGARRLEPFKVHDRWEHRDKPETECVGRCEEPRHSRSDGTSTRRDQKAVRQISDTWARRALGVARRSRLGGSNAWARSRGGRGFGLPTPK